MADIHRKDSRGAVLQEAIREPAGGGAQVDGGPGRDGNAEVVQRVSSLWPPRLTYFSGATTVS